MTFSCVALVRLNATQMTIFDSKQHALVAISRHTRSFVYCHPGRSDAVTTLIRSVVAKRDLTNIRLANQLAQRVVLADAAKDEVVPNVVVAYKPLQYAQVFQPIERHESLRTEQLESIAQNILTVEQALSLPATVNDQMVPISVFDSYLVPDKRQQYGFTSIRRNSN
ncbi:unnamed protein product [Haemonchus placei]|uniref:(+)RNA virus helicase C-terminal domain-containing protein n=1 Tax=Haemonchus placei TaxID=6290 RepID=A0A0N4X723_HAEPC|nr:unnamed protein product [Haemonchus placei]